MKWEYRTNSNSSKREEILVIHKMDVIKLQRIIPKSLLNYLNKNADKWHDKHQSGYGSEKDYDKFLEWYEKASLLDEFLSK